MLVYCAWTHFSPRCQYAAGFTYFICSNITIFLFLFLNFYTKSYKRKKDVEKEIKNEYAKSRNGIKTNGVHTNGFTKEVKENRGNDDNDTKDNNPYEVIKACGDYAKDGKVFITRRTAKAAYGPEYDFDSIIKKWFDRDFQSSTETDFVMTMAYDGYEC